jgi:hypothetical protein
MVNKKDEILDKLKKDLFKKSEDDLEFGELKDLDEIPLNIDNSYKDNTFKKQPKNKISISKKKLSTTKKKSKNEKIIPKILEYKEDKSEHKTLYLLIVLFVVLGIGIYLVFTLNGFIEEFIIDSNSNVDNDLRVPVGSLHSSYFDDNTSIADLINQNLGYNVNDVVDNNEFIICEDIDCYVSTLESCSKSKFLFIIDQEFNLFDLNISVYSSTTYSTEGLDSNNNCVILTDILSAYYYLTEEQMSARLESGDTNEERVLESLELMNKSIEEANNSRKCYYHDISKLRNNFISFKNSGSWHTSESYSLGSSTITGDGYICNMINN